MTLFSEEDNPKILEKVMKELKEKDVDLSDGEFDLQELISNIIMDGSSEIASDLLKDIKEKSSEMLEEWREQNKKFEKRLYKLWKKPIDLLEIFIILSLEAGSSFNNELREEAVEKNDIVFEALTKLHSRGCLVSRQIVNLLRSGYASGAHARWRTLHEIAAVSFFIMKHGEKVAEKYLLHDVIESSKAVRQYQEHVDSLGYERYSDKEVEEIMKKREKLCERFGKCYKNTYGWAAEALGKCRPNLYDIEKDAGINHLRPYYKMASHAVHANPKGVLFNLGLLSESSGKDVLIAGPSDYGLADPGQSTAISLYQINSVLLTHKPKINSITILKTLEKLQDEIAEKFVKVQKKIEKN